MSADWYLFVFPTLEERTDADKPANVIPHHVVRLSVGWIGEFVGKYCPILLEKNSISKG